MTPSVDDLARHIEHTLLRPEATTEAVERLCREALDHRLLGVCVAPCRVRLAARLLRGSGLFTVTVIGFPLGVQVSPVKALEAVRAVADGADELDMVLNVGALKDGDERAVAADIAGVVRAASGRVVKVILETALLTDEEKVRACALAAESGAAFVKTCTGFSGGGATVADVRLLRASIPARMGVKASGGIRTRAQALELLAAGADRLGTSASPAIVQGG